MKKFILNIMGVIGGISNLAVFATDKFEVLPDLPDPLAYAVQPAAAATVSGAAEPVTIASQSIGSEPSLISVVLSLLFVILLIYLTGIIYTKLNRVGLKTLKQQGDYLKSHVSVISTTQLGNNKTLHVVELDGKRMLIGASSGAIQLIKDLGSVNSDDNEEFSHIEIPNIKIPKIEIPKIEIPNINFSKLMTKTHKPIAEVENNQNNEIQETAKYEETISTINTSELVENSDIIIDSLFPKENQQVQEDLVEKPSTEHMVDPEDFALYKKYLS